MRPRSSSQFVVDSFVRLIADEQIHRVIWRGKLVMPKQATGQVKYNVYRLDNNYWDCYEYQLYPAQPWDNNTQNQRPILIAAGGCSPT